MRKKNWKSTIFALILAPFIFAQSQALKAQEVRDPNQDPKKLEVCISIRYPHSGYAGRVIIDHTTLVGQINGSLSFKLPSLGKFGLEGWVWGGYDPKEKYGELDIGAKITKEIFKYLVLGLEGAVYSIKVGKEGDPHYNLSFSARVPITDNLGASLSTDVRNLSNYAVGASYEVPLRKGLKLKTRIKYNDSYNFGKNISLEEVISKGPFYVNLKLMKAFENIEGETGKHELVYFIEAGFRHQIK